MSAVAVGALLLAGVVPAVDRLLGVSERFTPEVAAEPGVERLGFARIDAMPPSVVDDLRVVLDSLGPDTRMFDFTNQPGVVHYLLGLESPTRYPHVSMAIRSTNQDDLIDELAGDPPELVLWWSSTLGIPAWDEIINPVRHYDVSQWLLERYRPWFAVDGEVLYVRNDLEPPAVDDLAARLTGVPYADVAGSTPACDWGTAPMFLDSADRVGEGGVTLPSSTIDRTATLSGWVGTVGGEPATVVLAVGADGRELARAQVGAARADVPAEAGGGTASAFSVAVPLAVGESAGGIRLAAAGASGVVEPMESTAEGVDSEVDHQVEQVTETAWDPGTEVLAARPSRRGHAGPRLAGGQRRRGPRGRRLRAQRHLRRRGARTIAFRTTGRAVDRYLVQAASCPQWRLFSGAALYLLHDAGQAVSVRLVEGVGRN